MAPAGIRSSSSQKDRCAVLTIPLRAIGAGDPRAKVQLRSSLALDRHYSKSFKPHTTSQKRETLE
eukprot:5343215-Amphidinium_carterae.1